MTTTEHEASPLPSARWYSTPVKRRDDPKLIAGHGAQVDPRRFVRIDLLVLGTALWRDVSARLLSGLLALSMIGTGLGQYRSAYAAASQAEVAEQAPSGPGLRESPSVAHDDALGVVVLFGGLVCDARLGAVVIGSTSGRHCSLSDDTWTWDGADWSLQQPGTKPPARQDASIAYDAARAKVVLYGGYGAGSDTMSRVVTGGAGGVLRDTWTWDGRTWTEEHPATNPGYRDYSGMAYYADRQQIVLFGGHDANVNRPSDTWTWDGSAWTRHVQPAGPVGRAYHGMAYDADRHDVVLFGGSDCSNHPCRYLGDTWTWDGNQWSLSTSTVNPSPRQNVSLAYDSTRGQTILFGGVVSSSSLFGESTNETWVWDGDSWTQLHPATSPPPRWDASLVYVGSARSLLLLPGGCRDSLSANYAADGWIWDGTSWARLYTATSPPARGDEGIAYDAAQGTVLVYGGPRPGSLTDTWSWAVAPGQTSRQAEPCSPRPAQ